MSVNIIGIDPSLTATGIVCLSDGKIVDKKLIVSKKKDIERLLDITNQITEFIDHGKVSKIDMNVIEGFAFGARGQSMFDLGMLSGIIRQYLYKNWQCRFLVIQPTMLKKFITGKGNCEKSLILKETYKRYKVDIDDDNIADAYGLAMVGYAKFCIDNKIDIKLNKIQKEIIQKINKGGIE